MRVSAISSTSFGRVITDKKGDEYLNQKLGEQGAKKFKNAQKYNPVADIHVEGDNVYVSRNDKGYRVKNYLIGDLSKTIFYEDNKGGGCDGMYVEDPKGWFNTSPFDYPVFLEGKSCGYLMAPIISEGKKGVFVSESTEYLRDYGEGNEEFTNADLIATECIRIAIKNDDKDIDSAISRRFVMEDDRFKSDGSIGSKVAALGIDMRGVD